MEIKQLVQDLCKLSRSGRAVYIKNFLSRENIFFEEHSYQAAITNIEVLFEGTGEREEVLFFAHYDISPSTTEGANDNASSVAVLLCLAGYLAENKPRFTVRLVFNDTEEILGGLLYRELSREQISEITAMAGSFQYLKKLSSKELVKAVFILELSGIGDSLYVAGKSGSVQCDPFLNDLLFKSAREGKIRAVEIPVLSSDMISVKTFSLPGTVFGAIPSVQASRFLEDYRRQKQRLTPEIFPPVWNNMHTVRDTVFAIQEKSLQMIYSFSIHLLETINRLNNF